MVQGQQRLLGDALFYFQMVCALAFGLSQAWLMLTTTEGVTITWLAFWGVFLLINLSLSWRAHQVQASRITRQTVIVYATWTSMMLLDNAVFLWRDDALWTDIDSVTAALAFAGIALTLVLGRYFGRPANDPIVRGYLAVSFKATPQLTLAWNIFTQGGAGVSIVGITAGHLVICTRLGQILLSLREAGWDRNRIGTAIGEIANEVSWIVTTIAWFWVL